MSAQSKINEVNAILLEDYKQHNRNHEWIAKNIPTPKPGNRYENLRQDAPFYCLSSLEVMLNYYRTKSDFRESIDEMVTHFIKGKLPNTKISVLIDWILHQTSECIKLDKSENTDLQNVGWWMGRFVYIASIVSLNYNAQYEKLFIDAWCKYFTNENLDVNGFS